MYQSVFGSAASRVATFVCFCHETLFCIFAPPRLPFPALHLSSQAPRCFSPLLETVTFFVELSQTSSPPGVCGTFLNVNPKSQTLLQFLLTCHVFFPIFCSSLQLCLLISSRSHYGAIVFPSFITCSALCRSQLHESVWQKTVFFVRGWNSLSLAASHISILAKKEAGSV